MGAPRVTLRTIGKRNILDVEVETPNPRFPNQCPCCLKVPEPGRTQRIRTQKKERSFQVPTCRHCIRHRAVGNFLVYVVLALILAEIVIVAVSLSDAVVNTRVPEGGWRIAARFIALFRIVANPIGAVAAFLILVFSYGILGLGIFGLAALILLRKGCCDMLGGVSVEKRDSGLFFSFESRAYGKNFAQMNGGS